MSTLRLWGHYLPAFLRGTAVTLELTGACLVVALALGFLTALCRMARSRLLRNLAAIYIEVLRATPVIVLLFIAYFSLAEVGIVLPPFLSVVVTLGVFYATLFGEVFRGGIESVHRGQREAAQALGLTAPAIMRRVVLPQALLAILPPAANTAADLLKDTSLVVTIGGVSEIMYQAYAAASATFLPMTMFVLAALFYFPIYYLLSTVLRRWEVRYAERH